MSETHSARRLELLTSWKEIANFMGKGVRTVQRWEATLGLPVIRPSNSRAGIVMARPSELEAWLANGRQRLRSNWESQGKKDAEVRATFSECVQELRRYNTEVRALCDRVNATRETLKQEIDRLRFLYTEWNTIRGRALGEKNTPGPTKVN